MFRYDVLCIGSATVDHFLTIEEPFSSVRPGDKILVKGSTVFTGGGANNAACALAKLGLNAKVLTKLGSDHNADFIIKDLAKFGVKNIARHPSRKATDFATIISSTKEKDRIIYVHKGASEDLHECDYAQHQLWADWIYLASVTGDSFKKGRAIVEYAHAKGKRVLFNPSLYLAKKGVRYLSSILKASSILVLNKEEAQALLHDARSSMEQLLLKLWNLGPETVIITNGPKPLYAYHHRRIYILTPPNVKIVHTAGAGDAFTAGLLGGIIKGYDFADALRLGQVNASSVIQHLGTKNILLSEREAHKLINKYRIKVLQKRV